MLAYIVLALGLDPARIVRVVEEIGSVGSASVPVSLDRLLRTRPVRPGDRILMVGVGAGVAHGAILYRVGT
jgi:3-oxoacyl-[acyl-carrier-protein] synthase III